MRKLAIRLLTLALCPTVLALVPTVTPAAASGSRHIQKHKKHWRPRVSEPWSVGQARPSVPPYGQAGPVCPGLGRSFDCKVWPPPYDEDPDRKVSKY